MISLFRRDLMMKKAVLFATILLMTAGCTRSALSTPIPVEEGDPIATLVAATLTVEAIGKDYEDPPATMEAVQMTITPDPEQPTEAPPTAEPTEAPTAASTATITFTPTITQTPTITLEPTLAPEDPVLSLGVPDVDDTFDTGSIIYQYDEPDSSFQVDDGQFVITSKNISVGELWGFTANTIEDFYLEITGTFGDTCAGRDRYGLIFRAPNYDEGYLFTIACDGNYNLRIWDSDAGEYNTLKGWTSSDVIDSGSGGTNRLGVMAEGSLITGYINGKKLFELNDATFSGDQFGVLIASPNTAGFTVSLSQLVYWNLP
jgi:hypothetical protein